MKVCLSNDVQKQIKKIKKLDPKLVHKIEKQLIIFSINPKHPSLRTHKLSNKLKDHFSISVTKSIRMIYFLQEDSAYFIEIGTHDEVYKSN